jgi:hypothetical protein
MRRGESATAHVTATATAATARVTAAAATTMTAATATATTMLCICRNCTGEQHHKKSNVLFHFSPPEQLSVLQDSKGNRGARIKLRSSPCFWDVSAASDQLPRPGGERPGAHRDTALWISAHVAAR